MSASKTVPGMHKLSRHDWRVKYEREAVIPWLLKIKLSDCYMFDAVLLCIWRHWCVFLSEVGAPPGLCGAVCMYMNSADRLQLASGMHQNSLPDSFSIIGSWSWWLENTRFMDPISDSCEHDGSFDAAACLGHTILFGFLLSFFFHLKDLGEVCISFGWLLIALKTKQTLFYQPVQHHRVYFEIPPNALLLFFFVEGEKKNLCL